ncbi:MAG TPA: DUF3617 domain-containing protein [Allosphingosinicella sp.]|nr:DUF3617 domain-containing protein [Allosphingosinicella sp.]
MRNRLICITALLALGACEKDRAEPGMSEEDVAAQLAKVKVEPGQWEAETEIVSAKGALPQEALQQMTGKRTSTSNCITPQQAERPSANFLAAQQNSDCTYQDFRMEGGKLSGRMTCSGGQMLGDMVTVMNGDYGPQSYDMTMQMETPGLPGGDKILITARTRGKRVGECKQGE